MITAQSLVTGWPLHWEGTCSGLCPSVPVPVPVCQCACACACALKHVPGVPSAPAADDDPPSRLASASASHSQLVRPRPPEIRIAPDRSHRRSRWRWKLWLRPPSGNIGGESKRPLADCSPIRSARFQLRLFFSAKTAPFAFAPPRRVGNYQLSPLPGAHFFPAPLSDPSPASARKRKAQEANGAVTCSVWAWPPCSCCIG